MSLSNLFADIPTHLPEELSELLLARGRIRVERILSRGHASPPDFWYDQPQGEFVVLLAGWARLTFEDESLELVPGSFVEIPPHKRHRVEATDSEQTTIWLAIFYDA
ncbi:MAG: cupin domain-containing protein [Planctomycetaceae bacterium]|nr:cupin domain-containing protein [Planctomycetaceae bacterium]